MNDCVEWEGALTPDGYPRRLYRGNANQRWHRVVYAESAGLDLEDIRGQVVRHRCDNPRCVNPQHLRLGTHADNMRDRDARDRHGQTRVSLEQAREIVKRLDGGESGNMLSRELGLPTSTVYYQRVRVRRIGSFAELWV